MMLEDNYLPEKLAKNFDNVLFEHAQNIDNDQNYWFSLRGNSINELIDAATPLLGMTLRTRGLGQPPEVEVLYSQVVEEIKSIELELSHKGYEHAIILAYRYILCTFIDEIIMSQPWGSESEWAAHSLLTRFHNETWGGEKVFSILARLENEPQRYRELLEFIFLCLNLGFRGRYNVIDNGRGEYEKVVNRLYQTLSQLNDYRQDNNLTDATKHVVTTKYSLTKQLPLWSILVGFSVLLVVAFGTYSLVLHSKSMSVIEQLNQILQ